MSGWRSCCLLLAVVSLVSITSSQRAWDVANDEIVIRCDEPSVSQEKVEFVGFLDECDNQTKAVYTPTGDSEPHTDIVIDARNSNDLLWDTARYKRYGTYWPTANLTWAVPAGFTNLRAEVFYAEDGDLKFGTMKYEGSVDGVTYEPLPNVVYGQKKVCPLPSCWYVKKEETATWDNTYYYLKAIWPAPCAGEIGATYAASQRKCLSVAPPGWKGTEEEFDKSSLKDYYFAPQLSRLILGTSAMTPGVPTDVQLTPANGSLLVEWDEPANQSSPIIGYTLYYYSETPVRQADPAYQPPYPAKTRNVGNVSSVVLDGLNNTVVYIVRVAAINAYGAGPASPNEWGRPGGVGPAFQCNATPTPTPIFTPTNASDTVNTTTTTNMTSTVGPSSSPAVNESMGETLAVQGLASTDQSSSSSLLPATVMTALITVIALVGLIG